jgi:U3 small nucleolar RNA-associated protein 15
MNSTGKVGDITKLTEKTFPKSRAVPTEQERYWKKYETRLVVKESSQITHISICEGTDRQDFAVTSGFKVDTFCSKTLTLRKSFASFKENPYCSAFRADGKLIAIGDAVGRVHLYDYASKGLLRQMKGHSSVVRDVSFGAKATDLASVSDDKSLRLWDVAVGEEIGKWTSEHSDYIRSLSFSKSNPSLCLTGSYDHCVKVWDFKQPQSIATLDHGSPVESVVMLPGDTLAASAGGNLIKIWDLISRKSIASIASHQKTVTSLYYNQTSNWLLAGSLDNQVKVFDMATYRVVHSFKFPAAILAVGSCGKEDNLVIAGSAAGSIFVKGRPLKDSAKAEEDFIAAASAPKPVYKARQGDFVVEQGRRTKIGKYDGLLKNFRHSEALTCVMQESNNHILVVTIMEELYRRGVLRRCLENKEEDFIASVLEFVQKHIERSAYLPIFVEVFDAVFGIYHSNPPSNSALAIAMEELKAKLESQVTVQRQMKKTLGAIEVILTCLNK